MFLFENLIDNQLIKLENNQYFRYIELALIKINFLS